MKSAVNQRRPFGGSGGPRGRTRRAAAGDICSGARITAGEAALLAEIPTKFADRAWIVDDDDSSRAPWTGRPVRPSSAAANLQTHPSYTSGLLDSDITVRPMSSAISVSGRRPLHRPRTGGPRHWSRGRMTAGSRRKRRMTVTGVETVDESNPLNRRAFIQHRLNADLKVKVSLPPISGRRRSGPV